MAPVQIFTDSTNDLTPELLERHGIGVVPLYVTFGEESYRDGVDMYPELLYRKVETGGRLPKTAAPSPADFLNAFEPAVGEGKDIVYIGLSSALSSTVQNASLAASQLPEGRVRVVDSYNLSTGIGIQVLTAALAAEEGKSAAEIETLVTDIRTRVETAFIIDTLDYLYKGGRLSSLQNFVGSLLKIRPIVKVVDGSMILASKIRGRREKALDQLLQNVLAERDHLDNSILIVTHSMAYEEAQFVKHQLEAHTGARQVLLTETGCVISSHCGPGTVGVIYINK
ncbi:DegV family protein [Paenibacillus aurantius]|uniref:DegV family protein n=1 Tax=Paenibacillus aurantius TaxID=2918900 RepID=A0AA96LHB3_9BACL|nr:DegV family protein [Paenibacillus aurantius]WNQ13927.1 DegV family protein [Paenibacillus aurantius]